MKGWRSAIRVRGKLTPGHSNSLVDYWIEIRPTAFLWVLLVPVSFVLIAGTIGVTGQSLALLGWAALLFAIAFVVVMVPTAFISRLQAHSLEDIVRRVLDAPAQRGS